MRNIFVHLALVFSLSSFALGGGGGSYGGGGYGGGGYGGGGYGGGGSGGGGSVHCDKNGLPLKHCPCPTHGVPQCRDENPCGFECIDGFSPSPAKNPTTCVCPKPYTVCNGHCGPHKACPSSGYYKRAVTGNMNLQCAQGKTACPIVGRAHAWECVDTENDLESCGGCMMSSTLTQGPVGVDCTAIPGVSDVSCFRGQCVVHRCVAGYEPSALEDSCVEIPAEVLFTMHDTF